MTEITFGVLCFQNDIETEFGSSDEIALGRHAKIRDPKTGKSLGPNKIGELCLRSGLVLQNYGDEAKPKVTEDGWLLTGDVAYYDEDQCFYIVDGLKELIKIKRFQVAPAELEALLLKHPRISKAVVVELPYASFNEKPLAFLVKIKGVALKEEEIETHVAKFYNDNISCAKKINGGVRFVSLMPKKPTGKQLKREMKKVNKSKP